MIDKTNFLEPTPEYCNEFEGMSHELIKDWFNVDLIFMTHNYAKDIAEKNPKFLKFFNEAWVDTYKVNLTIEEMVEKFKDYPEDAISEMMPTLVQGMKEYDEKLNK